MNNDEGRVRVVHILKISWTVIFVLLITRFFIAEPSRIDGRSMEPRLNDEDFFLLDKISLMVRTPKRGEVIQFRYKDEHYVKRVIGLPGEQIIIRNGKVEIRNSETIILDESYLLPYTTTVPENRDGVSHTYQLIPPHSYFVMGDNRDHSTDSRHFSAVHRTEITGLVMN